MNNAWLDAALAALALSNLLLLASSRFAACIRAVAFQGVVTGLLALLVREDVWNARALILAAAVIGLKGVAFPVLLGRALRDADVRRELDPFVGYRMSLLAGVAGLVGSEWIAGRLPALYPGISQTVAPVALATLFTGLFLLLSRRLALAQILGYLALENGIAVFGFAMVRDIPFLVELGILLDAFAAVFVMGVAVYHIRREFDHIDADQLSALKG